jgi:hypothetical protein
VETNNSYSADKQALLNSSEDGEQEAVTGDFSYSMSAKKDGWSNYWQKQCGLLYDHWMG